MGSGENLNEHIVGARWPPVAERLEMLEEAIEAIRELWSGELVSHRGCSLHEGQLHDDTVTCPCHGSTFRLDGSVAKGPATAPQPTFDVRTSEGKVEIRRAEEI